MCVYIYIVLPRIDLLHKPICFSEVNQTVFRDVLLESTPPPPQLYRSGGVAMEWATPRQAKDASYHWPISGVGAPQFQTHPS